MGVARALAATPKVMLLDEPFGALDPLTRDRLQQSFMRIRKENHLTAIFVTHDMVEALILGDRIAVMRYEDCSKVVLLGDSGSGKTTTLKMVNRLIDATSGVIRLDGEDVREVPEHIRAATTRICDAARMGLWARSGRRVASGIEFGKRIKLYRTQGLNPCVRPKGRAATSPLWNPHRLCARLKRRDLH